MRMDLMQELPRIMGNADPLRYSSLLPGIQTNSEYDAGVHIEGCDNGHNAVRIDGVTIYNPAHMLGFFSVFNASHFSEMSLSKHPVSATQPNRLGGVIDMLPSHRTGTEIGGELAVGPMSSQGTLRLPLGARTRLTLSAREAYLNLLYGPWLKTEDEIVKYSFGDYNLSLVSQPDSANTLSLEAYAGHDNVGIDEGRYQINTSMKWGNMMAAATWSHVSPHGWQMRHKLFTSGYQMRFGLEQTNMAVTLNASVLDFGLQSLFSSGGWTAGLDVTHHTLQPQHPTVSGALNVDNTPVPRQLALEGSLFACYQQQLSPRWQGEASLRATLFQQPGDTRYAALDPGLTLRYALLPSTTLSASLGLKHQYLHLTGISDMGLPVEFWFAAGGRNKPQYAFVGGLSAETFLADGRYRLVVEGYYRRLYHQTEYVGNAFDFLYGTYSLDGSLIHGHGTNYGASVMLEKRRGPLTGWVGYAYGRARRRFDAQGYDGTFPAAHERQHEFNAVATYRIKRWRLGSTLVMAGGTPFTKIERFYLLSNHVMAAYGRHNGARLTPYVRLDLSACYDFKPLRRGGTHGINLSVYNVTMHRNTLFYRLKINSDKISYSPLTFAVRMLPSINYYVSF